MPDSGGAAELPVSGQVLPREITDPFSAANAPWNNPGSPAWPRIDPCYLAEQRRRQEEILESALWHASQGWPVGPCEVGGKAPLTRLCPHGVKNFTTRQQTIIEWFLGDRYAVYNLAVATGAPGPDVLDVDVRPDGDGWAAFGRLKTAGMLAGAHRLVQTRSGGLHVYFAGTDQRCGRLKAEHLDFKSAGGYVLVPPSYVDRWHADDGVAGPYEPLDDRPQTGATFDWAGAVRLLRPPPAIPARQHRGGGSVAHLPGWVAQQPSGNRNNGLFWAACRVAEAGDEELLAELTDAGVQAGLDQAEAARTVASAVRTVSGGR
jgi:hypothetical protein